MKVDIFCESALEIARNHIFEFVSIVFVRKLIPDGIAFTILRDPVEAFESGYVYYGLFRGNNTNIDINEFAATNSSEGMARPSEVNPGILKQWFSTLGRL